MKTTKNDSMTQEDIKKGRRIFESWFSNDLNAEERMLVDKYFDQDIQREVKKALDTAYKEWAEQIAEEIRGINPKMPDEVQGAIDEYDDYLIGYGEAKIDALLKVVHKKLQELGE